VVYVQTCVCVDWTSWSADSHTWMTRTCSGTEPYTVTWSTHAIFDPAAVPPPLTVTTVLPTTKNYVRPYETISFQLSTTTREEVEYVVNFGDPRSPQTLRTTDAVVGHAWSSAGNYSVNITAITCSGSASKIVQVQIHDVQEGVRPENLAIKPDIDRRDWPLTLACKQDIVTFSLPHP